MLKPELLRRAWPAGYLLRVGLQTEGGWMCTGSGADVSRYIHLESQITGYLKQGRFYVQGSPSFAVGGATDLLPLVDPAEVATWALLKVELARLAWPESSIFPNLTWTYWPEDGGVWDLDALGVVGEARALVRSFPDLGTSDPAEALVLALISVRKRENIPDASTSNLPDAPPLDPGPR
jgi:hypothetical protein